MTDKPTVTVGDLVCVGFAAGRNPDGTFNGSIPLFRCAEPTEDDFDGLTWDQLTALFDDLGRERGQVAATTEDAEKGLRKR